jgi:hypothetical protein
MGRRGTLLLIGILVLACLAGIGLVLRSRTEPDVTGLRLDAPPFAPGVASERIHAVVGGLSRWCDESGPDWFDPGADVFLDVLGPAPSDEALESARGWLAALAPQLVRLDTVLEAKDVQAALARGDRLAQERPRMDLAHAVGSFLCIDAILTEDDGRAAARLGTALDLAAALDDRSLIGTMIAGMIERRVTETAFMLLGQGRIAPSALRTVFEPRLTRPPIDPLDVLRQEVAGGGGLERLAGFEVVVRLASVDSLAWFDARSGFEGALPEADDRDLEIARMLVRQLDELQRREARRALLRTRLAIEVHRAERGAWPEELDSLAALFPAGLPTDPLTGRPFAYARVDGSRVLGPAKASELSDGGFAAAERNGLLLRLP